MGAASSSSGWTFGQPDAAGTSDSASSGGSVKCFLANTAFMSCGSVKCFLASTREGTKQHSLGLYWASLQIFQGSSSNILRSYCASRPRSAYLVDRGRSSGPTTQWIRREGGDCEVKQGVSFESAGAWFHEQAV